MQIDRTKKNGISLLLTFCVFLSFVISAKAAPLAPDAMAIKRAMNYFKASQNEDGGFGHGGLTEWTVIAISAAGQDPRLWYRNGNTPLAYLRNQKLTDNPYDWIRMLLALTSMGEDPRDFNGVDYIRKIKNHYQKCQFGDPLSLRDDYWAVLALSGTAERDSEEVQDSVRFILEHQNPDGSWSASTTGVETCADNTAAAIIALSAAGQKPDSAPILKGLRYLKGVQRRDGGFSYLFMPSNAASSSWVLQALRASGEEPGKWNVGDEDPASYLLGLQEKDGSFKWTEETPNSPLLMTAYAVPALLGKWIPVKPSACGLVTLDLRIEGEISTILHTRMTVGPSHSALLSDPPFGSQSVTAISALAEAVEKEGIDYVIEKNPLGVYLKRLAGESDGWQYRVNDRIPMASAHEYRLKSGDELVWFYDKHGWKSPLRILPNTVSAWEGEIVRFLVKHFDDAKDQWFPAKGTAVVVNGRPFPAPHGDVSISFEHKGQYDVYAEKEKAIRSLRKTVTIAQRRPVTVSLRIEDNGRLLCEEKVSFSDLDTKDVNGRTVILKKPTLIGVLEAARKRGFIDYRIIRTAEGIILISINGLEENNEHGSWWYKVNEAAVVEDIDEYEMNDADHVLIYRSMHPR